MCAHAALAATNKGFINSKTLRSHIPLLVRHVAVYFHQIGEATKSGIQCYLTKVLGWQASQIEEGRLVKNNQRTTKTLPARVGRQQGSKQFSAMSKSNSKSRRYLPMDPGLLEARSGANAGTQ